MDFLITGTGPLLVFASVVILILLVAFAASRYKVANANEALIVAGSRGASVRDERGEAVVARDDRGVKVVVGSGTFVRPLLDKVGRLKLTARQISVELSDAVSSQGIKVAVQGVATFKIGRDVESIRNAAERFLEAPEHQVDSIVKNVLEGSLRSIVGTLTVEELNLDRQKFQQAVQDAAKGDLATSGLVIDAFTIQSIVDQAGYMNLVGQQKLAIVERDARIAKATADQEAAVREAQAEQIKINAARDVALRRAEAETQTSAAQARAAQAGPLAQAEATQEVVRRQTELAQLEADRRQKELLAQTVRPAEAEAEAQVRRAEGEKRARIAAAEAEAERVKLTGGAEASVSVTKGEAQAKVVLVNAQAEAEKTKLEGNAEAGIVFTKGEAEAKALAMRAEAYKQFNDAAVLQTVLSMLPEIVTAAASPMSNIDSLTVLSTDGASEIVKTATRTVAEAGAAVKGLTGVDLPALIGGAMEGGVGALSGGIREVGGRLTRPVVGPPASRRPVSGPSRVTSPIGSPSTDAAAIVGDAAAAIDQAAERIGRESAAALAGSPRSTGSKGTEPPAREASSLGSSASTGVEGVEAVEAVGTAGPAAPLASARWSAARVAQRLAELPNIGRWRDTPLSELAQRGTPSLREIWRLTGAEVIKEYGSLTLGEFLEQFAGEQPG